MGGDVSTEQALATLVQRAVDGDEHAWGSIVDRFAPLLWGVCRRLNLVGADADDVAQAGWLRLLEHLPTLRVADALPGWLVTTTRRECVHQLQSTAQRDRRERPLLPETTVAVSEDLDEALLRAERRDALRAAFTVLGERCRRLL